MFYDDPGAAFANLVNWLVPGGRFAFAVWGRPADNPWFTCVRDVVADVIDVPNPDADAPGPFRYSSPDKLLALLDTAGFGGVEVHDWHGALPIGGGLAAADAANFALAAFSSFGELLAAAGEGPLNDARRSLAARFTRYQIDGTVRMDACVHIVTGGSQARCTAHSTTV
jgi:SAM-dependent methyltransferase